PRGCRHAARRALPPAPPRWNGPRGGARAPVLLRDLASVRLHPGGHAQGDRQLPGPAVRLRLDDGLRLRRGRADLPRPPGAGRDVRALFSRWREVLVGVVLAVVGWETARLLPESWSLVFEGALVAWIGAIYVGFGLLSGTRSAIIEVLGGIAMLFLA